MNNYCTCNLQEKAIIFIFIVVWNPWIEKAKSMSDFGDNEVRDNYK